MLQFNNRGILMKNVMGIIIAVIGLAIFFAGVYGIYQVNKSQTAENARKTLDSIMGKIELLEDGENNTFIIRGVTSAKDWYLVGWSKEEGRLQGKPDKCFDKSCICVCKGVDECQENGFCRDVEKEGVGVSFHQIHGKGYNQQAGNVYQVEIGSIPVTPTIIKLSTIMELEIIKDEKFVNITRYHRFPGSPAEDFQTALDNLPSLGKYFYIKIDKRVGTEEVERF